MININSQFPEDFRRRGKDVMSDPARAPSPTCEGRLKSEGIDQSSGREQETKSSLLLDSVTTLCIEKMPLVFEEFKRAGCMRVGVTFARIGVETFEHLFLSWRCDLSRSNAENIQEEICGPKDPRGGGIQCTLGDQLNVRIYLIPTLGPRRFNENSSCLSGVSVKELQAALQERVLRFMLPAWETPPSIVDIPPYVRNPIAEKSPPNLYHSETYFAVNYSREIGEKLGIMRICMPDPSIEDFWYEPHPTALIFKV